MIPIRFDPGTICTYMCLTGQLVAQHSCQYQCFVNIMSPFNYNFQRNVEILNSNETMKLISSSEHLPTESQK